MVRIYPNNLCQIIKQQRLMNGLTLRQLSEISGVSASHLTRIERRERFPYARILRRIAQPLGFEENELFAHAGYLTPDWPAVIEGRDNNGKLEPYVASMLASEPIAVQYAVIGLLEILKSLSESKE